MIIGYSEEARRGDPEGHFGVRFSAPTCGRGGPYGGLLICFISPEVGAVNGFLGNESATQEPGVRLTLAP